MKTKIAALLLALTLTACGGNSVSGDTSAPEDASAPVQDVPQIEADLSAFYAALLEEGEWPALMPLEDEALDAFYPGLSELPLEQCLVYTAAISSVACEIALVETENAGDAETAADIFQARIDYQVGDENNPGGAWYPMTIEGWETTSQIVTQGNYVLLAVGDRAAEVVLSFNALFE